LPLRRPGGMVQGQMLDMASEGRRLTPEELKNLHALKTGAMIEAALACGAVVAGGSCSELDAVAGIWEGDRSRVQVVDDILNVEGDPAVMGKATGTDRVHAKIPIPTYGVLKNPRNSPRI